MISSMTKGMHQIQLTSPTMPNNNNDDSMEDIAPPSVTPSNMPNRRGPTPKLTGNELCLICGNPSSGFNYGVLSCEGCKAFYRRSITNQNKKKVTTYQCSKNNNCNLFTQGRSKCRSCRFRKCKDMGMNLLGRFQQREEYVMNKDEIRRQQRLEIEKNAEIMVKLKTDAAICESQADKDAELYEQNYLKKAHYLESESMNKQKEVDLIQNELLNLVRNKQKNINSTIQRVNSSNNKNFQNQNQIQNQQILVNTDNEVHLVVPLQRQTNSQISSISQILSIPDGQEIDQLMDLEFLEDQNLFQEMSQNQPCQAQNNNNKNNKNKTTNQLEISNQTSVTINNKNIIPMASTSDNLQPQFSIYEIDDVRVPDENIPIITLESEWGESLYGSLPAESTLEMDTSGGSGLDQVKLEKNSSNDNQSIKNTAQNLIVYETIPTSVAKFESSSMISEFDSAYTGSQIGSSISGSDSKKSRSSEKKRKMESKISAEDAKKRRKMMDKEFHSTENFFSSLESFVF